MNGAGYRTPLALALQAAALAVLALALLGFSWLDARSRPRVLVLIDRSASVPRAAADAALADVVEAAKAAGIGELRQLEFAGRPGVQATDPLALDPLTTNVEAALEAALEAHAESALAGVVIISDGLENAGDATRALRAVREARLPLQWIAIGRPPPATRVASVLAPDRVFAGQPVAITVQLAGRTDRPLRVSATARGEGGETHAATSLADSEGRATIGFDAIRNGAVLVDVELNDAATGERLGALPNAAVIDVVQRAAILYAQGSPGALSRSLAAGGWPLTVVPAARLDAYADALDTYRAVVLDDVAIADAGPRFWSALVAAVQSRGLGLLVLGGERSFGRGGYRGTALESLLPVLSEPAVLDRPASVVFVVDKSGSMGSGDVDRFSLAQRAVLETARGLTERDSLGLVVFDVAPRVLIPLGPAPAATLALARDWQASPGGGTRLAPALEAAIGELERADAARRILIVVTDGFLDEASLPELRARLDRARIEMIALAVGPDADAKALERLVGGAGTVLRVGEAAELPLVMRTGLERHRARVERGTIAVEQRQPLPFASGTLAGWPAVGAYAVTRSLPRASVAVQSSRGDPLIAFHRQGSGRVMAVTCGLGPWTPQWLQWPQWRRLAGGLADWVSGAAQDDALQVSDLSSGLQVDADVRPAPSGSGADALSIAVRTPTTPSRLVPADNYAPGRLRATLPDDGPGLYAFEASTSLGTQRLLHLRRKAAENETWGTNPALQAWRRDGLVADWDPAALAHDGGADHGRRPVDRTLIGLVLALFSAGVAVDRLAWTRRRVG